MLAAGCKLLTEPEAKDVLAAYGIAVVETRSVSARPEDAAQAATALGPPVALNILSPDITHKSDVADVMLDLVTALEVREAATDMLERVARERPGSTHRGLHGPGHDPAAPRAGADRRRHCRLADLNKHGLGGAKQLAIKGGGKKK